MEHTIETMSIFGDSKGSEEHDEDKSIKDEDNKLTYDQAFKRVFRRKDILAGILVNIVPELKSLTYEEVKSCIVSSTCDKINAETLNEEDSNFDKKVLYDVVVKCSIPSVGDKDVLLLFDLEMQRKYNMSYPIMKRAVYYASRILSGQLSSGQSYEMLNPVYSAWICMYGIPDSLQNSVCSFRFAGVNSKGADIDKLIQDAQLLNIDLLLLSESYDWDSSDDTVIKFLQSIFKNNLMDRVFNPYLDVDANLLEEVALLMSKDDEYREELRLEREEAAKEGRAKGIAEGRAEGRAMGRAEGRAEGRTEGRTEGIIETCIDFGLSVEQIAQKLNLSVDEVNTIIASLEK